MFGKKTYSELEVKEMMDALFQEKRRVKELELKLKNATLSPQVPAFSEELDKLKNDLLAKDELLLEKSAKISEHASQMEMLTKKLGDEAKKSLLLADELNRYKSAEKCALEELDSYQTGEIQSLRLRGQEAEKRVEELLKKLSLANEALKKKETENVYLKTENERSMLLLKEECGKIEGLREEEIALKAQFETLKTHAKRLSEELALKAKESSHSVAAAQKNLDSLHNRERELDLQKQMMMKTLQEFKEERLREEMILQKEIETLSQDLKRRELEIEKLKGDLENKNALTNAQKEGISEAEKEVLRLKNELQETLTAKSELAQFSEELKTKVQKAEEAKRVQAETLSKKEELVESLSNQVANLARSLAEVEETMHQAETESREHESRLRVAQQHLAKRVKEATLLAEINEELKGKIQKIEKEEESLRKRLLEKEATLEAEGVHQTRLKEQYQEALKTIEAQSLKWEEKYFQLQERLQLAESRNRDMKRLEERFTKMQGVMTHLAQLFGTPLSLGEPERIENLQEFVNVDVPPPVAATATIQSSVFDPMKKAPRFKESLFG